MPYDVKALAPLSKSAQEALDEELKLPAYQGKDEGDANIEAAVALLKKERIENRHIFDRSNPTDRIAIQLAEIQEAEDQQS